jgi:hypothetical protein
VRLRALTDAAGARCFVAAVDVSAVCTHACEAVHAEDCESCVGLPNMTDVHLSGGVTLTVKETPEQVAAIVS